MTRINDNDVILKKRNAPVYRGNVYSNLEDGYLFFCSKINVRKPDRPIKNELSRATENIGNKTQDEDNTTQKTERMSNADPPK